MQQPVFDPSQQQRGGPVSNAAAGGYPPQPVRSSYSGVPPQSMTTGFEQHRGSPMQSGVGGMQQQQPGSANPSPQHQLYAGSSGQQQQQPGVPGMGAYAAATHGQTQVSGMYSQQPNSGPVSCEL